ncbi:hypothetical protein QUA26_17515 [Microcoleus sp. Pol12A4]
MSIAQKQEDSPSLAGGAVASDLFWISDIQNKSEENNISASLFLAGENC